MSASDRFAVTSFTATGTIDFINDKPNRNNGGLSIQAKFSGNGSFKVLVNNWNDQAAADFVDVTSLLTGVAQMLPAVTFASRIGFNPYAVRIVVDSLQAANSVKVAVGF